jgi:hypothetical protein
MATNGCYYAATMGAWTARETRTGPPQVKRASGLLARAAAMSDRVLQLAVAFATFA